MGNAAASGPADSAPRPTSAPRPDSAGHGQSDPGAASGPGSDRGRDPDCLFCRIIAGEVPSTEVLSTEAVYAFRDINPGAPLHVLLVPRAHIRDAATVTRADGPVLAALLEAAQRVAADEGVAGSGYRLVFNVGDDAGNTVAHLHLHLLGGRRLEWPPG